MLACKVVSLAALLVLALPLAAGADDAARMAPAFRLRDTHGSDVALADFTGKVILLDFWATWCTSCREGLAELDQLHRQYRDNGFTVIAISVDTSAERVAAFLNKRPVGFPVVTDTQGTVAEAYCFSGLPAAFLINRDGVIVRRYRGSGMELISRYEKDIEDVLNRN
jgi:peroxiredoxin